MKTKIKRPERLSFPPFERQNPWLSMLLDAYFIGDKLVYEGITRRLKRGEKLACKKGCSHCCSTHITIPVYPLEIIGIYWFTDTQIKGPLREAIATRLLRHDTLEACPFLIDGACMIHPMRPLACRFFNVFNRSCAPMEDPYYSRRKDVLTPSESLKEKALMQMLPFHGIRDKKLAKKAVKEGYLNQFVKNLREIEWKNLGTRLSIKIT